MTLRWRSHPVLDDYPRSLVCVAAIVLVCAATYYAFGGLWYLILAALMLGSALGPYFLATDYELDEEGVYVRFLGRTKRVAWDQVRRFDVDKRGIRLSPFRAPSRLDSFRGASLRFCRNSHEVIDFVRRKLEPRP